LTVRTNARKDTENLGHKRVLAIALPIVVSNATVPILGAVDTGVIGQMGGAAPIGGVGIGAIILTSIYWIFGFLRMGTVGLVSQALGQNDRDEMDALLSRVLMIGLASGFLLILFQIPIFALAFMVSPASNEVESLARDYMVIRVFSAPAMISLYGLTGWLIAQERTRGVLVIQLWMNGLNIGLNFLFVLEFGWGIQGVASASLIAEWTGFALAVWLCRDGFRSGAWKVWGRVFEKTRLVRMALVSSDILVRSVLLQAAFVSFLFLGGDLGDVPLAANQILLQFIYITSYALDGFAFAAETLVGQAMGAKNRARLRRAAYLTSLWGGIIVVCLAAFFWFGGQALVDLMATSEDVRAEATKYLPWMIAAPVLGAAAWMLDGIFIGATRSADMRNMMAVSFVVYLACLAILLPSFGNHGLWASLILFFVARGITLGLRYPALERAMA
jgi:multidrug resistance protein, MATE family